MLAQDKMWNGSGWNGFIRGIMNIYDWYQSSVGIMLFRKRVNAQMLIRLREWKGWVAPLLPLLFANNKFRISRVEDDIY